MKICANVSCNNEITGRRDKRFCSKNCWNQSNPEPAKKRSAAWRLANPERAQASVTAWVVTHRAQSQNIKKRNKIKRKLAIDSSESLLSNSEWMEILEYHSFLCFYCDAPWEHMDHFVPLSKGGTHTADNVVPACAPCNLRKSNKNPMEFLLCMNTKQLY